MRHFEESWLTNNQFRPSVWFRYVDDTFSLFDSKDTASRFLDFLNSRHPNIKFTMELEENREIPFLDVCIKRDHSTFSTTIHHKKTFTGLYTKWDSFTPRKYKVNLIRTLTYRCLRICSKSTLLQSALYPISRIPCFKMVILKALLTTMLMIYFTNIRTSLHNLLSQFLRKI